MEILDRPPPHDLDAERIRAGGNGQIDLDVVNTKLSIDIERPGAKGSGEASGKAMKKSKASKRSGAELEIIIGTDESRVIDEAIEASQRGRTSISAAGVLCISSKGRSRREESHGPRNRQELPLCGFLESANTWPMRQRGMRPTGDDEHGQIHPPDWVVKADRRPRSMAGNPPARGRGRIAHSPCRWNCLADRRI